MDRAELYEVWQQNKDRPAFVREYRDELMAHLSTEESIPEADSLSEVRDWLERYRGTVTRQLNDASDGTDPHDAETTTDPQSESGGE